MEKQVKQFNVDYDFNWEYGIEISKLKEDVEELEKLGATHIYIDSDIFYDCSEITIEAKFERLETDEEFKQRVNKTKQREDLLKHRELTEFKRLKQKYGL